MKFKIGDKVKILKHDKYPNTGAGIYWDSGSENDSHKNAQGKIGFIINDGSFYTVNSEPDGNGDYFGIFSEEELVKIKAGRPIKSLPTKYVVFYEENNVDPMKTFTTEKELKRWLSEAKDDKSIDFSSIRVFEVKKELKVKTSFKLVG